jgi:hypothetical protein
MEPWAEEDVKFAARDGLGMFLDACFLYEGLDTVLGEDPDDPEPEYKYYPTAKERAEYYQKHEEWEQRKKDRLKGELAQAWALEVGAAILELLIKMKPEDVRLTCQN